MYFADLLINLNSQIPSNSRTGFWKEVEKLRWLKEAIAYIADFSYVDPISRKRVVCEWDFWKTTHVDDSVADQEGYDLPADYKPGGIKTVLVDGNEAHYVPFEDFVAGNSDYEYVFTIIGTKYNIKQNGEALTESGLDLTLAYLTNPPDYTVSRSGTITTLAAGAAGVTNVTVATHGLTTNDYVSVGGSINYDGLYKVTVIDANSFSIPTTFISNDAKGTVYRSTILELSPSLTMAATKIALSTCLSKGKQKDLALAEKNEADTLIVNAYQAQQGKDTSMDKGSSTCTRFD